LHRINQERDDGKARVQRCRRSSQNLIEPIYIPAYPHFDGPLSQKSARELIASPVRVAQHCFSPFLRRRSPKRKFRGLKGAPPIVSKPKHRMITYAGRCDSVIFRRYRDILSERYEDLLQRNGLEGCVLAYRSIPSVGGHNKCNIDFAIEAFDIVRRMGDCTVFCLDIKSFFDTIAHEDVAAVWKQLLEVDYLPDDHFAVMKAATKYSFIDEKAALGILGFFGEKQYPSGPPVRGYLVPRRSLPTRLCDRVTFNKKIAPNVAVNKFGIPQGLPISDVLANAVLLHFDLQVKALCETLAGHYYRYSDDLFFVIPGRVVDPSACILEVERALGRATRTLKLGHDKTAAYAVERLASGEQRVTSLDCSAKAMTTIDYLGLSYDGTSIYLRQSTLSRLERRIVDRVRRHVVSRLRDDPNATQREILSRLHLQGIMREFGRIEGSHRTNKRCSTRGPNRSFRCYAVRASQACGFKVSNILAQISHLNDFIRARARREVRKLRP
jgi:hypothetical protein